MGHIDTHKLESSNIKAIGHTDDLLRVEFRHGGVYDYSGDSDKEFIAFEGSESKGRNFVNRIKGNFSFRKEK